MERNFAEGEYYHVYNRGVEKRLVYLNDHDRWRFLSLLFLLQGEIIFPQIGRLVPFVKSRTFDKDIFQEVVETKYIGLVSFCLMPNHFHLILDELKEGSISRFMQRLLTAYTKYFNIKYKRTGHLFGGAFQAVHIDRDEYLQYLSAYIHLNPRELTKWRNKEIQYPWSSYQDYVEENRWGNFLSPSLVLDQFKSGKEYQRFIEETPIKKNISEEYLIDL
ncbi:MAG: transposase [Candidatus Niyogibacteria bacterium]|nr:transposase [Candidatus Niyogibacteria bacterium]